MTGSTSKLEYMEYCSTRNGARVGTNKQVWSRVGYRVSNQFQLAVGSSEMLAGNTCKTGGVIHRP